MAEIPEISRFLGELPGFEQLDERETDLAARGIEIAYYRQDSDLFQIGDANNSLNVVRSGAIELRNAEGDLVLRLAEGDSFGFPSLMNAAPVRNHSRAIEDTLVYHLDGDAFHKLRRSNSHFDNYYIRALSDRLLQAPAPKPFRGATDASVASLIGRQPVTINSQASISETAQAMVSQRVSAMLVVDDDEMIGIVTDRDIRSRVVAVNHPLGDPVASVMTPSPITLEADSTAYTAALVMMQNNIHHLPVVDNGKLLGMVSRSDFMRLETEHPLYLVSDIAKQSTPEGIVEACGRLPDLILSQIETDADGEQLGQFITTITDTVTRQLLKIAERQLGPAPCAFAWVAMGSQGRFEQSAKSDQDNALIYADDAPSDADDWFAAAARIVNDGLDACGYVYCPGDVMASNPKWRQPLQQWQHYFHNWITVPESKALMHANIFFDLRCVYGDHRFVDALKAHIRETASGNELFLALMTKNAMNFHPPLGFFRQFVLDRSGEHKNTLDLKLNGIMPIVEIARIRSLDAGQVRITTRNRLKAAAAAGELTAVDAQNLIDALDFIEQLRLEHQSRQMHAGEKPDNHLSPAELSPLVRQNLKAAFAQVRTSQQALANRFHFQ